MPDTPPGSGVEEPDAGDAQQPDDATKSLDVPEWVSELRRLYVEPQTRAKRRQEGSIAPQKRKLGLPGLRGSRRPGDGNGDDRAGGAHSARSHSEPVERTDMSQPAATPPPEPIFTSIAAVPPGQVTPARPDPAFEGDGVAESDLSKVEPQPLVEEQVGAWLNSYLVATGHAADDDAADDEAAEGRVEDATTDATVVDDPQTSSGPVPTAPIGRAGAADAAPSAHAGPPGDLVGSDVLQPGAQDRPGTATEPEPLEEAHRPSLAELAGLSPPEPGPDTWLPAVPPPPAAVAYDPPVDTVVTSMPEPGREPEPEPEAARERVSQPATRLEPIEEPVALPVVTEPAAEGSDEPEALPVVTEPPAEVSDEPEALRPTVTEPAAGRYDRSPALQPTVTEPAAGEDDEPEAPRPAVTQPAAAENDQPADLQPAVTEPPEGEFDEPEPALVEGAEPVEAVGEATPVAAVDESTHDLAEAAPAPAVLAAEDARDTGHRPSPGRPSTVPAVTLSWREAESFDIGLPDVEDDDERAIVVEPPSQLVAQRRRRREAEHGSDLDAPAPPSTSEVAPDPELESDPELSEADVGASTSGGGGKGRWILVAVLCLLIVAAAAWYCLLRDDGSGSGARSGTSTVCTASTLAPADRGTRLV